MEQSPLVSAGLPIALFVIMVGIGLVLTVDDFRWEARQPRGIVAGSLAQLLAMPALGFAIAALLRLPPELAVGLVIVAASPGGSTSNVVAYLARANVALSIVLTVLASVAAIVTLPFYVDLALARHAPGSGLAATLPVGRTVVLLLAIVLVPVSIGMAIRRGAPARAAALERGVSAFGAVVLVVLIAAIAWSVRDRLGELLATAGPAALLLNLGGIAVGWTAGRVAGLSRADRMTTAIELGVKNSTIGMLVAITVLGSEAMAVPSAVYGLLMYLTGIGVVAVGRRSAAAAPPPR
jgi:bile acid:Na+ symporter, BASS family